jgi:hypothetical protein
VYPRIKQADDEAQVVLGGLLLSCPPDAPDPCAWQADFLEGILDSGGKNFFDFVGIHAYDYYYKSYGQFGNDGWNSQWNNDGPVHIKKAQFIRSVLDKYNASDKEIMLLELSLICSYDHTHPSCTPGADSDFETTQAMYVAKAYATSLGEGYFTSIWYDLNGGWENSSLLFSDLSYKDAFWAYKTARDSLKDASYEDSFENSGVKIYEFDRGDRFIWLMWSKNGTTQEIDLPETPLAAWDYLNNPIMVTESTIQVGMEPIYLEWLP